VRSPRAASLLFATDNRRNGHHACSKLTVPRANQPLHGPFKVPLQAILAKLSLAFEAQCVNLDADNLLELFGDI
jgi:hypothetical protein